MVSNALSEFLEIMEKKICPEWIKAGMTEVEKQNARTHFYRLSELPGIIQAIDCTHIKIHNPGKDRSRPYRNKKGFYSLNVLLVGYLVIVPMGFVFKKSICFVPFRPAITS